MAWCRGPRRWPTVVLSIVSAVLFVGGSALADGLVIARTQLSPTSVPESGSSGAVPAACGLSPLCEWLNIPLPAFVHCNVAGYYLIGNACDAVNKVVAEANYQNAGVAANNTMIATWDFLNITNAEVSNLNATLQELLSYFEDRAEAIVPYFLNDTWNQTMADFIAVWSGLVPAIEGMDFAYGYQQFQDWNATAQTWDNAFGASGQFGSTAATFNFNTPSAPNVGAPVAENGHNLNATLPYEYWSTAASALALQQNGQSFYFNMEPGGTIIQAPLVPTSSWSYADYMVTDLNTGVSFQVPDVTYANWANNTSIPIESTIHGIGPFDLLKLTCVTGCQNESGYTLVEASGAYAFRNVTTAPLFNDPVNSMAYQIGLNGYGPAGFVRVSVPEPYDTVCLSLHPAPSGSGACTTVDHVPTGGTAKALGSGPGSVLGGNSSLITYGPTAQGLVNNTLTMAYDYYLTLRALTDHGKYNIPPDCAIPTPSDAFPAATDYANYQLSAANLELAYLAYLNSVAKAFDSAFTEGLEFCDDAKLAMSYNWSTVWKPTLNLTLSEYLAGPAGPETIGGTNDTNESLTHVNTWAVQDVQPALVYPFTYQMNVPLNTVYPVPANDPIVALLMNYPGNLYYGTPALNSTGPNWGLPTYNTLSGNGALVLISGNLSNIWGGKSNASADAIDISSCVLNGVPESTTCPIAVTYYNNFTVGLVYGLSSPYYLIPPGGGGGGLAGLSGCGFGILNQWYDSWAGYIGSAIGDAFGYFGAAVNGVPIIGGALAFIVDGIGCFLAWVVVILLFALFLYVVVRVVEAIYRGARNARRSRQNTG